MAITPSVLYVEDLKMQKLNYAIHVQKIVEA